MNLEFPAWLQSMVELYRAAISHVFVLTGNIDDYATGTVPLISVLESRFAHTRDGEGNDSLEEPSSYPRSALSIADAFFA